MGRHDYLWYKISIRRAVEPAYWRLNHMDRKKICEIYYGIVDPYEKAIWRMLVKAYYHKVSEKEIMGFLIYYRGHSEDYTYRLIKEIRKMWLRLEWIKVLGIDPQHFLLNRLKF